MSEQNKSKGGCNTSSVLVDDALGSVDSRVDAYVVIQDSEPSETDLQQIAAVTMSTIVLVDMLYILGTA